jgi:hypothetical protein
MPKVICTTSLLGVFVVAVGSVASPQGSVAGRQAAFDGQPAPRRPTLPDAQRLFFNAQYDEAAVSALALRLAAPEDLAACELHTSTLLFQLKTELESRTGEPRLFAECGRCPGLLAAFLSETTKGQALARGRLQADPSDDAALFFLGKIDLNYVWLQLGPLGRRTGWDEYWEARRSLDAVIKRHPLHVRARVARAWIDYIVDTRMPRGTKWVLGGGNRKRALLVMQDAANAEADFFVHVEALFALWDLHVRERNLAAAVVIARGLAQAFPDNRELGKFLETHDSVLRS